MGMHHIAPITSIFIDFHIRELKKINRTQAWSMCEIKEVQISYWHLLHKVVPINVLCTSQPLGLASHFMKSLDTSCCAK